MVNIKQYLKTAFIFVFFLIGFSGNSGGNVSGGSTKASLEAVESWFYFIDVNLGEATVDKIANSTYDMVVIDTVFTEKQNTDYPITDVIQKFKSGRSNRLVLAYVDIGQAEEWRTYWQDSWGIGSPTWIVANDPDGWEGNYPVAYWHPEWQAIWIGTNGYVQQIVNAGFDGIYLDWVEAYSDKNVITAAASDSRDPEAEMVNWVKKLGLAGKNINENFVVIAQNASELLENADYINTIDAIAQEQTWFDGAADNNPPGDCPLPRTEADVDTRAYYISLSAACKKMYDDFPGSTLHVSSESYLYYLQKFKAQNFPVFTVDYAVEQKNIEWTYQTSRSMGFIPFVGERALGIYLDPY